MRGRGEEKFTLLGQEPSLNWYTRRSRCQALNWEVTAAGGWAEKTHPTSTVAESSWGHGQGSVWVIRSHSASSQVSVGSQTTGIPGQLLDLRVVPTCEVCGATAPPTGLSVIKLRSHPTRLKGSWEPWISSLGIRSRLMLRIHCYPQLCQKTQVVFGAFSLQEDTLASKCGLVLKTNTQKPREIMSDVCGWDLPDTFTFSSCFLLPGNREVIFYNGALYPKGPMKFHRPRTHYALELM